MVGSGQGGCIRDLKKWVEEAGRREVQDVEFGLGRLGGEYSESREACEMRT